MEEHKDIVYLKEKTGFYVMKDNYYTKELSFDEYLRIKQVILLKQIRNILLWVFFGIPIIILLIAIIFS